MSRVATLFLCLLYAVVIGSFDANADGAKFSSSLGTVSIEISDLTDDSRASASSCCDEVTDTSERTPTPCKSDCKGSLPIFEPSLGTSAHFWLAIAGGPLQPIVFPAAEDPPKV